MHSSVSILTSKEVLDPETATMWFASTELLRKDPISKFVKNNNNTKITVKLAKVENWFSFSKLHRKEMDLLQENLISRENWKCLLTFTKSKKSKKYAFITL